MTKPRIDQFFLMHSARSDSWRAVMTAAESWSAGKGDKSRRRDSIERSRSPRRISCLSGIAPHAGAQRSDCRQRRCRHRPAGAANFRCDPDQLLCSRSPKARCGTMSPTHFLISCRALSAGQKRICRILRYSSSVRSLPRAGLRSPPKSGVCADRRIHSTTNRLLSAASKTQSAPSS